MRVRINIDTQSSVSKLVGVASSIPGKVDLTDGTGMRVSAKSLLGAAYAAFDFSEIWLETEGDHYFLFKEFIVGE